MSKDPVIVEPGGEQYELAVDLFKILADNTRLRILWALLHGEHSVNNLADHVGAQPPAVSQHLAKLRLARLVKVRRLGNRMFYAAEDAHVRQLVEQALSHAEHVAGGLPERSPRPAVITRAREGAVRASAR
jgi:DNA-binding transcriptional ArsR family regulator